MRILRAEFSKRSIGKINVDVSFCLFQNWAELKCYVIWHFNNSVYVCTFIKFSVSLYVCNIPISSFVIARLHISVSVCECVPLSPPHHLYVCVCVYLQPNGSGQNKLPGSFLLPPPPPPVARPVPMPLPLPEHKPSHTHPESGVGSPASPCKCPLKHQTHQSPWNRPITAALKQLINSSSDRATIS